MLVRWRAFACDWCCRSSVKGLLEEKGGEVTNRSRTMEHADVEIPQEKPAVVANTSESICPFIATPWVEGYCRYPRVMSLASSNYLALREGPDRH